MIATNPEFLEDFNCQVQAQTAPQVLSEALQNWGAFLLGSCKAPAELSLSLAGRAGEVGLDFAGKIASLSAKLNLPLYLAQQFDEALAPLDSASDSSDPEDMGDWPEAA